MDDAKNDFLILLRSQIETTESICDKIEKGGEYMEDIKAYLPSLKEGVAAILQAAGNPDAGLQISAEYVMQVLQDILDGMERGDSVFLLDAMRYGLLEIYYYAADELEEAR